MKKAWLLTVYLVASVVTPVVFGWFDVNRVECRFCFRDERAEMLTKFVLLGAFFGIMSFLLTYRPLWW